MINSELEVSFLDFIFHLARNNSVSSFIKFIPWIYLSSSFKVQAFEGEFILVELWQLSLFVKGKDKDECRVAQLLIGIFLSSVQSAIFLHDVH